MAWTKLITQIPDAPGMAKVFWMSGEDDKISRWRLDRVKKLPPTVSLTNESQILLLANRQKLSWNSVKRTFSGWLLYVFSLSYAFWSWATNSNTWIILFLVSLHYCVQDLDADGVEKRQKSRWKSPVFGIGNQCYPDRWIRITAYCHVSFRLAELKNGEKGYLDCRSDGELSSDRCDICSR